LLIQQRNTEHGADGLATEALETRILSSAIEKERAAMCCNPASHTFVEAKTRTARLLTMWEQSGKGDDGRIGGIHQSQRAMSNFQQSARMLHNFLDDLELLWIN